MRAKTEERHTYVRSSANQTEFSQKSTVRRRAWMPIDLMYQSAWAASFYEFRLDSGRTEDNYR